MLTLTEAEKQEAVDTLKQVAAEMLSNAQGVKARMIRPQRILPLAVVLSHNDDGTTVIAMVSILDLDQRVQTLKQAVKQCHGYAFAFIHDGFLTDVATTTRRDALLAVSGTAWGVWRASAAPYQHGGLGASFSPTVEVPEVCVAYHGVFQQ